MIALGEPVGAAILAYAMFGELIAAWTMVGSALILAGIWLVVRRRSAVERS